MNQNEIQSVLSNEQRFFLNCLSDYCKGKETEIPQYIPNPEKLFQIANEHCLDSILYLQCRKKIPFGTIESKLRRIFYRHVFYSANRADILKEITERFRRENISLICFKGSVLRDYYPQPELRTMGDIDILIRPENRKAVDIILRQDMHFNRMIDNHAVWTYWIDSFGLEVHDHMFYENLTNNIDYRYYFDDIWNHCRQGAVFGIESDNLYVPEEEYHFLYIIAHTAKHIMNNGIGFRTYLDMVLMTNACKNMRWEFVCKELKKLSLNNFAEICMRLCEIWFDIEMPLISKTINDSFVIEVTRKTIVDGVFGFENDDNKGAVTAKDIRRYGKPYYIGALIKTISLLFPSYSNMELIPWYSFIKGRPWLLPIAWVYRWFYCLIKKTSHSLQLVSQPYIKKTQIDKRQIYLSQWGL